MLEVTDRETHAERQPATGDMNCCMEHALMMALCAASSVRTDYPAYVLRRASALLDLVRTFYTGNILLTDGEAVPADPEALREHRTTQRHHILRNELKIAAARNEEFEALIERHPLENETTAR
jgi:hypothetical protein